MSGRELDPDGTDSYHPQHPWEQTTHPLYRPPRERTTANWPPVPAQPAGPSEAQAWAALPHKGEGVSIPNTPTPAHLPRGGLPLSP